MHNAAPHLYMPLWELASFPLKTPCCAGKRGSGMHLQALNDLHNSHRLHPTGLQRLSIFTFQLLTSVKKHIKAQN